MPLNLQTRKEQEEAEEEVEVEEEEEEETKKEEEKSKNWRQGRPRGHFGPSLSLTQCEGVTARLGWIPICFFCAEKQRVFVATTVPV